MAFLDLNNDIKPWLGIPPLTTTHDSVLTIINLAMEQAVLNYTETDFAEHVVTNEIHDANESDIIVPRNIPVKSIEAIYLYSDVNGVNGSLLDSDRYYLDNDTIVLNEVKTPFGRSLIRLDYTWGYNGLPADIKLCMLQAVEAEFRRKGNKSLGVNSRSKKDESESFDSGVGEWDSKSGLPKVLAYKLTSYKSFEFPNQPMAARNI